MRKNIRKMYTYVAKNLITVAIYKCVLKSLRLSQRDIKIDRPVGSITSPCSGKWARTHPPERGWGSKTGPGRRRKSSLTGQTIPAIPSNSEFYFQSRLSSQIINIMQEEMVFQQNVLKKAYFLSKWLVRPWSGRPVLTFGKRPKLFQNRLLTSKIISLPCTDNLVYLFNLLSTKFYSATLLKNSFIWLFSECFSVLYAQQNLFETLLAVKIKLRMNAQ